MPKPNEDPTDPRNLPPWVVMSLPPAGRDMWLAQVLIGDLFRLGKWTIALIVRMVRAIR